MVGLVYIAEREVGKATRIAGHVFTGHLYVLSLPGCSDRYWVKARKFGCAVYIHTYSFDFLFA